MHHSNTPASPTTSLADLTGIDRCHLDTIFAPSHDTDLLLIFWSHTASNVARVLEEVAMLCESKKDTSLSKLVILQEAVDLPSARKKTMGDMVTNGINRPKGESFATEEEYNRALGDHLVAARVAQWTLSPRDRALFEGMAEISERSSVRIEYKFIDLEDQSAITRHLGYTAPHALSRRDGAEKRLRSPREPGEEIRIDDLLGEMRTIVEADASIISKERNDLLISQIRKERDALVEGELCVALIGAHHLGVALPFLEERVSLAMVRLPDEVEGVRQVAARVHQGSLHAVTAMEILERGDIENEELFRPLFAYLITAALEAKMGSIPRLLDEPVDAPRRRKDVQEVVARELTLMLHDEEIRNSLALAVTETERVGADNLAVRLGDKLLQHIQTHHGEQLDEISSLLQLVTP